MILKHRRRCLLLHPPVVWEQCYSRNSIILGNQLHSPLDPCQRLSADMPRLKRRPWLPQGPVRNFIVGKHFLIETDHKPLVPLLGVKHLDSLPPRVLRFRLLLDRFSYNIKHFPSKEPLIPTSLPQYPWQQVAADLFHLKGEDYLVLVDYFSRYPEVHKLKSTTSQSVSKR